MFTVVRHLRGAIEARLRKPERILEVGGGTGMLTHGIADLVTPEVSYTFSDVSQLFLTRMKAEYGDRFEYKRLDFYEEIGADEYDLILGADCVHAVPQLEHTLGVLLRALRAGGQLVLMEFELQRELFVMNLVYGIFSDWYSARDQRSGDEGRVLASPATWKATLTRAGFAETHIVHESWEGGHFDHFVVVGQKSSAPLAPPSEGRLGTTVDASSSVQRDPIVFELQRMFCELPLTPREDDARLVVHLPSSDHDEAIRSFLTSAQKERPQWHMECLPLVEHEFVLHSPQSMVTAQRRFAYVIESIGDAAFCAVHERHNTSMGSDAEAVWVTPCYVGVNFKDYALLQGLIDLQNKAIGMEFSGVVTAVGANVGRFKAGDRVFGLCNHGNSNLIVTAQHLVAHATGDMKSAAACAIAYTTAIEALERRVKLRGGERVLVLAAGAWPACAALVGARMRGRARRARRRSAWLREHRGVQEVYNSRTRAGRRRWGVWTWL